MTVATIISLGCALLHNSMRWFQLAPDGVYHVCTSQYSERCSRRGRLRVIATPPHFSPLVLHFCNTLIVSVVLSVRRFYSTTCAAYYFPRMPGRYPASRSLFSNNCLKNLETTLRTFGCSDFPPLSGRSSRI